MKYKFILLFCFFIIFSNLFAEYNIEEANLAYQNQNYQKAEKLYIDLINEGVKNFILFYNLGDTYYKIGNIGLARLYFEKAAKYKPLAKDLQYNIQLIKNIQKDKEDTQKSFFIKLTRKVFYFLSINKLLWGVLIIFIILMITIAIQIICRNDIIKKLVKTFQIIFSLLFIIFMILTITRLHVFYAKNQGIILEDTVFAYSGPSKDFQQVFTIHEGLKVKIEKYESEWVLIKLQSGNGGWIQKESLGII